MGLLRDTYRIPSFKEFIGEDNDSHNEAINKTTEITNNSCPGCGANLKDETCEYCGNFYGKKQQKKKRKIPHVPSEERVSIENNWRGMGMHLLNE